MSLILQIEGAELAYGSHPLLDGAGLRLMRGERLGLIGRNGSGKSSLLRVIAGQAVLDGHIADAKKDVKSFLSGVGAASDELEKGDAAVVLDHVLTGTAAVETLYPGLDQDIEMVEEKLAELMTRRHERDALKTTGKRLREHVAPLAAAEGVFKRAK